MNMDTPFITNITYGSEFQDIFIFLKLIERCLKIY